MTGPIDVEAIYYASPIPANGAVLTILGLVFDKVYFPGVYLPTDGFDPRELEKEIKRLEALKLRDTQLIIGLLKFVEHAKTLAGFCEFTGSAEDAFGGKRAISEQLVNDLYDAIHGPRREGWIPMIPAAYHKALPGGEQFIAYPDPYHYLAGSLLESERTGKPLLVDHPGLPVPGMDSSPADDAKLLSTLLAVHCTSLVLPRMTVLSPSQLMDFRGENEAPLRHFRRAMLRHAGELNGQITGLEARAIAGKTQFYVETHILPELDELREALKEPRRTWRERIKDGMEIIGNMVPACFSPSPKSALLLALMKSAPGFIGKEVAAGDAVAKRRRSDLYYLLQVEKAVGPDSNR